MNNVSPLTASDPAATTTSVAATLARYYHWHAPLYDATRWSFLFGRAALIDAIAERQQPQRILEIGCGTGSNLLQLRRKFPTATLMGVDLSADMLARARRKLADDSMPVALMQWRYDQPLLLRYHFDLVLFSYCLSMMEPGWEAAIQAALEDLRPGGLLAVVDFHDTPSANFRRWMACNHVHMTGQLLPYLQVHCHPILRHVQPAYRGIWRYFSFLGAT
jgi:S-adenosylmethionine-diacylgycerolhomoserine-N-methlytransferase